MRSRTAIATLAVMTLLTGAVQGTSDVAEMKKPVSYKVRLCEGEARRTLNGAEARESWSDCDVPLTDVPVHFVGKDTRVGPIKTDAEGIAKLGPLEGEGVSMFTLGIACTTHTCMTLRMEGSLVHEGENLLLYYAPLNAKQNAQPVAAELPAGILSTEEIAAIEKLSGIDSQVSMEFEGIPLSSMMELLGRFASFTAEFKGDAGNIYVSENLERQTARRVLIHLANKYDLAYEVPEEGKLVVSRRSTK